jgi:hypothetical protein
VKTIGGNDILEPSDFEKKKTLVLKDFPIIEKFLILPPSWEVTTLL